VIPSNCEVIADKLRVDSEEIAQRFRVDFASIAQQ
jgi:hypothetical protein